MVYYPRTVELLKSLIDKRYVKEVPKRDKLNMPAHLLWMMEEMQTFSDDRKGSAKAGRWIGWIFREMEMRNLLDEERYLDELKNDVENGWF